MPIGGAPDPNRAVIIPPRRRFAWVKRPHGPQIIIPARSANLALNGIALILTNTISGWPTSTADLAPGDVWANGIFICAVPGATPNPTAFPMLFGSITSTQLLLAGAGNLPLSDPENPNQLWLNGIQVCASVGGFGLAVDGIALILTSTTGWPISTLGLSIGGLWANGIFVNAVTPTSPVAAPPVFFGRITSTALLALGGANLPLSDPGLAGQLWLNGVQVCVSLG